VTRRLQALLDEGAAAGVFPCARATVLRAGQLLFEGGAGGAGPATVFDLASVTKVVCTTAVFLSLWRDGVLAPETAVGRHLPGSATAGAGATVEDLLRHRGGLPAFVPFFADVLRAEPRLRESGCPRDLRRAVREKVVARALATAPGEPPRRQAQYGDVGFIVLGELLARAAGRPLDILFTERVARPLGLAIAFRRLSSMAPGADHAPAAPTGGTRPREPAPGQEGLWADLAPAPSPPGEVDDDNAWVMDGVAGHAGLFGTAGDLAAFGHAVLEEAAGAGRIAPAAIWTRALTRDAETPGSTRALGFDTRLPGDDPAGASAGRRLGTREPGAVGHLGFTGVSLWVDRARGLVVVLCTNRTARGRAETRIRAFRPGFHDAVVEDLLGER
jgi:CubicO group peptidase (beta-lactamase class C family)